MFSSDLKYVYIFLTGKQDKILNCNASPDKYTDKRRTRRERLLINLLHIKQHLPEEEYFPSHLSDESTFLQRSRTRDQSDIFSLDEKVK